MDDRIAPLNSGVVIFGTGTFAQVVHSYMRISADAYTVDREYIGDGDIMGTPVVPFDEVEKSYPPDRYKIFIAVTQQNRHRFLLPEIYEKVTEKYRLASIVHPTAFVGRRVLVGTGSLVSPHAIVESYTWLFSCVFVRSGAYVGHNVKIGNFSYIAPRASIAGHCTIGQNVFIGNNATIRDRLTIGDNAIIGCGATVLHHVEPNTVIKAREGTLLPVDAREVNI